MNFTLEYPPSVNNYWKRNRHGGMMLTNEARAYKDLVRWELKAKRLGKPMTGKIKGVFTVYPPDKRRRDLDNVLKGLLDSMEKVAYENDSQFQRIEIEWGEVISGGKVEVMLSEIKP